LLVISIIFGSYLWKSLNVPEKQVTQVTTSETSIFSREETLETTIQSSSSSQEYILNDTELLASADKVAYGVYYFNDKKELSHAKEEAFIAASVIKVFIMEYVYTHLEQTMEIAGYSVDELVRLMIQNSDNQATNILIDFIGLDTLNEFFATNYTSTQLQRKMLDENARAQGLENYTSVKDDLTYLETIYLHRDQFLYSEMLQLLLGQTIRTKIPSKFPEEILIANKTGELENVENDVALILDDENPLAIVILTEDVHGNGIVREAIGNFALEAWHDK
jgi:beta-lactamase class A